MSVVSKQDSASTISRRIDASLGVWMNWLISEQRGSTTVRVIASPDSWIESDAVNQLMRTADLPGMIAAVGMPDLHPGKGTPVGAVFASQGIIYPYLVGNDIGCGMSLWKTDLRSHKLKLDRWVKKLSEIEGAWDQDTTAWLDDRGVSCTAFDSSLGTIGGGNHFAELQRLENRFLEDDESSEIDDGYFLLLIHSGSRGLGESILRRHTDKFQAGGLDEGTPEFEQYIGAHDHAVKWARANRDLIAHRFLRALGAEATKILDVCHNSVMSGTINGASCWLHRKGAAPADQGIVVIPGSRGAVTYLVKPVGDQSANLDSLAHGAGRKWGRSECKGRLQAKFTAESLLRSPLGNRIICEDKSLLYEEAPQAYKKVESVVQDLVQAGCINVIATLTPVITYKVSRSGNED